MGRDAGIEVLVDGRSVSASEAETVLDAARRGGADIPTLCGGDAAHRAYSCRVCVVEIDDSQGVRLVTACDTPARAGMRIVTRGDRLSRLRRASLRLHLAADPGSQQARDLARTIGLEGPGPLRSARRGDHCVMCGLCPGVYMDLESPGGLDLPLAAWRTCVAIERLRSAWGGERPCRYALMGLVPGALCSHDYDCRTCPFDHEMLDREPGVHPASLVRVRRARR
ncbi:MAG: (2Fe-2S)-binding protein [Deltaproteobacteria bacterium]|nr:(2Fe-2S)-binding protein [Deltaproteobacteria bacterium]